LGKVTVPADSQRQACLDMNVRSALGKGIPEDGVYLYQHILSY
jgi:hypothetical protein